MYMNVYALVCVVYICMVSAHGQHGTAKQPDEEQPHVHAPAYGNTDKLEVHHQDGPAPPQMNQGQHQRPPHGAHGAHGGNRLHDKHVTQDKEHIKEHLDGVAKLPDYEMTEEELQFHYFKLHDYDNNNMLDGTELISAMTHFHHENDDDASGFFEEAQENQATALTDDQISEMVDNIIQEDDRNKDGYIDYHEFMMSQQR